MTKHQLEFPYQACTHNSKLWSIVRPGLKGCLRHISHHLAGTIPLIMLTNTYTVGANTFSYMCRLIIGKSFYWICMWYWYYCFCIALWLYRIMDCFGFTLKLKFNLGVPGNNSHYRCRDAGTCRHCLHSRRANTGQLCYLQIKLVF